MSPSPFVIQPIDRLGVIQETPETFLIDEGVSSNESQLVQEAFVGTSISNKRISIAGIFILLLLTTFLIRAAYIQLYKGNDFFLVAEGNRTRDALITPKRGRILDTRGKILAQNQPAFSLWFDRSFISDELLYVNALETMALLLDREERDIHDLILQDDGAGEKILISNDVAYEKALQLMAAPEAYPGMNITSSVRRSYATQDTSTLSAILGYTGSLNDAEYQTLRERGYTLQDTIGKTGLEKAHEDLMRGFSGNRRSEIDALGREALIIEEREAIDGADLVLHLDSDLQAYIEDRLDELRDKQGIKNASIVVVDPRNGGIRALVSYPGYDNNLFARVIDSESYKSLLENPAQPLFSRALSGQFPSGSTFKPVVAAIALDEGVIDTTTRIQSSGGLRIGQFFFPDWKAGGHGSVNVTDAIAESVNTFFYVIGGGYKEFTGLGLTRMMEGARNFGLGSPLGIDLPGEASGFLPSALWKERVKKEPWYVGDTYHVAIGQGDILVTPLQVAMFTSVFANGGTLYRPQIVDRYITPSRDQDIDPHIVASNPVSEDALQTVRKGLRQTVTSGSAVRLNSLSMAVAGKTGTAQWHSTRNNHAWFTGFGPYEEPEIVVTVLIEEGGEGSSIAVPLAGDIFAWWHTNKLD